MSKVTKAIILGYLTCDDPVVRNKYANILDSFFHKDEGVIITKVEDLEGGSKKITFSDATSITVPSAAEFNQALIEYQQQVELDLGKKVDKVLGKGLSTNDFSNILKQKLDGLQNYVHPDTHTIAEVQNLGDALNQKQDAEEGKGLSTHDFTQDYKDLLDNFQSFTPRLKVNINGYLMDLYQAEGNEGTALQKFDSIYGMTEFDGIKWFGSWWYNTDGDITQQNSYREIFATPLD
ncbi:MAG: hypothetical protein V7767_00685 [Leeuwenhoekiella sp.]